MGLKKYIFYWSHGIIAIAGSFLCALLIYGVVSGVDRGHPPAIVFLPAVIITWLILHIFLIFIQWMIARGNKNAFKQGNANTSWPLSLEQGSYKIVHNEISVTYSIVPVHF